MCFDTETLLRNEPVTGAARLLHVKFSKTIVKIGLFTSATSLTAYFVGPYIDLSFEPSYADLSFDNMTRILDYLLIHLFNFSIVAPVLSVLSIGKSDSFSLLLLIAW